MPGTSSSSLQLIRLSLTMAKRSASSNSSDIFKDPGLKHPTVERARKIDEDLPYERLRLKLNQAHKTDFVRNVLHWFRTKDMRAEDNKGLASAAKLLKEKNSTGKLLTLFVVCPAELDFHGVGSARRMFMVDNYKLLAKQLHDLGIPLIPVVSDSKKRIAEKVAQFAEQNDVSHVYANYEYEHDEIFRDIDAATMLTEKKINFTLFHDQTIVEPGLVTNAQGEPRKVFTSYWNSWISTIAKSPGKYYLNLEPVPEKQAVDSQKDLLSQFEAVDLDDVLGFNRSDKDLQRIAKLWPTGHNAAKARLYDFLTKKVNKYGELRSNPADDCVSRMSAYFALGIISVREALVMARKEANSDRNFGTSSSGVDSWVREIAFREFYRHMVATVMPHVVMNMPTSHKLANVQYEEDQEAWDRWCAGNTGVPFVDAGMRQLLAEGYMHNRLRMNVASYLRMNLLIDYRLGLRFFANKLVDWDCCNNLFGWDPNYTVFNPVAQAERLDPNGDYIRKWVPELKDVSAKAIFAPSERLSSSEFKKLNYPSPMIDQQTAKQRSMERYKQASGKRVKQEDND